MDIRLSLKNPIKDSNNNIVTIEVVIEAYYQTGTKVYDESFMWNSPFDKRIPFDMFPPATLSQRKGKSEEEMKPILDIDEIYIAWYNAIHESPEWVSHEKQAELLLQQEPHEKIVGTVVLAK